MQRDKWRSDENQRHSAYSRPGNLKYTNDQQKLYKNHPNRYDPSQHYSTSRRFENDYRNQYSYNNVDNKNVRHDNKPYERSHARRYNRYQNHTQGTETPYEIPICPLEAKIDNLIAAVKGQIEIGQLVLMTNDKDNAGGILQNAIQSVKDCCLNVVLNNVTKKFELSINGEVLGETDGFKVKQIAKNELYETVLEKLKKKCFYIIKKENYEEVSTGEQNKPEPQSLNSSFEGSKAYSMMLKMGWGGKGLGVQEQGEEKTVADKMIKNITKEGLGSSNVMAEIDKILQDYISSSKVSTLVFDSSFSKKERAQIHNLAQMYNLKSKSLGKEPVRRITITKKMAKWDLVKELLRSNLENDSYKLLIPDEFHSLWFDASD